LRMLIGSVVGLMVLALRTRVSLQLEILALRPQLTVCQRSEANLTGGSPFPRRALHRHAWLYHE